MKLRVLIFLSVILLAVLPALPAKGELPDREFTLGLLGGIVTMPLGGEVGEVADWNGEFEGVHYGGTLELAGTALIEGTLNLHERVGVTLGFGYIRYFSAHSDVDTQAGFTCTAQTGGSQPCEVTIRIKPDDIQIWPVYVGARYYLTGVSQEEGGIYIRGDIGGVIYQQTEARIYLHPSAPVDITERDQTIYRDEWWDQSVSYMFDGGLGFSFFSGPVGVFGEVRYLFMGAPESASLDTATSTLADNDADNLQTVMAVMGIGFNF